VTAWRDRLARAADHRRRNALERALRPVAPAGDGRLTMGGKPLIDLCSNDYLGLARHPAVVEGARLALERYGAGARASRLITGNYELLEELEAELAAFKGTGSALVFPSGYQANLGLLSLLIEPGDAAFVDRLAHACLVDGVRLSGARLRVFPHNDVARLGELLAAARDAPARWIMADAVYSMDGDVAPLGELLALAREHDATVILDDAHGTGVMGATGRGTAEALGIDPRAESDRLIIVATLSKALGSQGGVVLGPRELREGLLNASRPFVYSTGLAPAAAGAALAALRMIQGDPARVARLAEFSASARDVLGRAGLDLMGSQTPILPILMRDPSLAVEASRALREDHGILVLPIRPPTVPRGTSRLRATISLNQDGTTLMDCCEQIVRVCQSLLPRAGS